MFFIVNLWKNPTYKTTLYNIFTPDHHYIFHLAHPLVAGHAPMGGARDNSLK